MHLHELQCNLHQALVAINISRLTKTVLTMKPLTTYFILVFMKTWFEKGKHFLALHTIVRQVAGRKERNSLELESIQRNVKIMQILCARYSESIPKGKNQRNRFLSEVIFSSQYSALVTTYYWILYVTQPGIFYPTEFQSFLRVI